MKNNVKLERGGDLPVDGGGHSARKSVPAGFYKPDTALPFIALQGRFTTAHTAQPWLADVRARAVEALGDQGLPTMALERWKYSNIMPSLKGVPRDMAVADISWRDPAGVAQPLGAVLADAPSWLRDLLGRVPPGAAAYGDMGLWYLANAFLYDGIFVDIPADRCVDKPLELTVSGVDGMFFNPRAIVRLGAGARMTLIEYVRGTGHYWGNSVAEIVLGDGAQLYHYRIQDSAAEAVYTQTTHVMLGADALYESCVLASGAGFSRNQVHCELAGPQARAVLNGVSLLRGQQLGDNTFLIEHQAPDCTSSQMVRTVLDQQARGVFQGKVHVHRAGQRTDGYQLSNALILSEGAEMDTKPELEIYADDVKCSHGATIGQVDDEALFYLRSRGIDRAAARALLIEGFLAEVVETIACENVQAACRAKIRQWLKDVM